MTKRVVFDVNILVSALLAPSGAPAKALRSAVHHGWKIAQSAHIVTKLLEVMWRPHISEHFESTALNAYVLEFQRASTRFEPDPSVTGVADDLEDDRIVGTALTARADVIVTGDKGLLALRAFASIPIVSAQDFLDLIDR